MVRSALLASAIDNYPPGVNLALSKKGWLGTVGVTGRNRLPLSWLSSTEKERGFINECLRNCNRKNY